MGFVFFLGGYDAEMCEIKNILVQMNQPFYDKQLVWGTKVSAYQRELSQLPTDAIPVLIELKKDMALPENAIEIDHHDEKAGKDRPTSIEQVAELLGIALNRWQQLIAANDRAWIDGLKAMGATEAEIQQVRRFDRQCQGVTEEEEQAAEQSIKAVRKEGDVAVVEYPFKRVSPVMDRLYGKYENILVITPHSVNFSGQGALVERLAAAFPQGWYGGNLPEKGFWGMEMVNKKKILDKILQIIG
ncbi:hypothetical protein ACX8XP_04515 [Calditrichota bacterium LG25]